MEPPHSGRSITGTDTGAGGGEREADTINLFGNGVRSRASSAAGAISKDVPKPHHCDN